jgi:hypothetical protein
LQFEPVELIGGDNVAGVVRIDADKGAIFHLPAGENPLTFEVVPALQILAVEQQLPSGGFFGARESVVLRVGGGEIEDTGAVRTGKSKMAFRADDISWMLRRQSRS